MTVFKKILIFLLLLAVVVIAVYYGFVKKNLTLPVNTPTLGLDVFSNSYIVGYEGDFQNITYQFLYPKDKFSLKSKVTSPSIVTAKNLSNGDSNTISFFYNGAAGFSSAKELWEVQYKSQCNDCFKIVNALSYSTNNIATYANATDEWIIFAQTPGFVIAHLKKPVKDVLKIIESLTVTSQKTEGQPEFSEIKIYFANDKIKPVTDCKEIVAVKRTILKTPKIATAAMELLFDGPSEQEKAEGYVTNIPKGSEINSLSIKGGTTYADFNEITESGGGSCSMAMRVTQIKQTLLQFSTINNIILSINGQTEPIFQP